MAMNIHQEARRRQMHMDRVCEARRRMALEQDDTQAGACTSTQAQADPVRCTDQGQFYQTRSVLEEDQERQAAKPKKNWKRPQKVRQMSPEPRPCPPTLRDVQRDKIYKILHPHTEY